MHKDYYYFIYSFVYSIYLFTFIYNIYLYYVFIYLLHFFSVSLSLRREIREIPECLTSVLQTQEIATDLLRRYKRQG